MLYQNMESTILNYMIDQINKQNNICDIRIKVIIPGFHPGDLGAVPGYRSRQ